MINNQHSKHSKANVSPNREVMLGQTTINFSMPDESRWPKKLLIQK